MIRFAYENKIPIPEASKLMTKPTPEKIPATSALAPEEKDPEIPILRRDIEKLKTQITAMKIAAIPIGDRITTLEISIQTLKKQIEPLLVIPEAVNTIKAEMQNGFSATFNQLQSLTALLQKNLTMPASGDAQLKTTRPERPAANPPKKPAEQFKK